MTHDDDISICEKIRKVYPLPSVMICRSQNNPLHCTATARVQAAVIGFRFEEWDELELCLEKCRTFMIFGHGHNSPEPKNGCMCWIQLREEEVSAIYIYYKCKDRISFAT